MKALVFHANVSGFSHLYCLISLQNLVLTLVILSGVLLGSLLPLPSLS